MRYPGKDQAGESAKSIPFTSHSGPRVAARGDVQVIPHPDAVSRKSSGGRARKIHSFLRSSLDPASQRGVTRSHTAPRCGIQKKLGWESPQKTFPFTSLSGPRVVARGDVQSYRTRCGIQKKLGQECSQDTFPFYVPLWPRVAARGDALGHTAPRCGIQEKIRQESPPNPFLLRPSLAPRRSAG